MRVFFFLFFFYWVGTTVVTHFYPDYLNHKSIWKNTRISSWSQWFANVLVQQRSFKTKGARESTEEEEVTKALICCLGCNPGNQNGKISSSFPRPHVSFQIFLIWRHCCFLHIIMMVYVLSTAVWVLTCSQAPALILYEHPWSSLSVLHEARYFTLSHSAGVCSPAVDAWLWAKLWLDRDDTQRLTCSSAMLWGRTKNL